MMFHVEQPWQRTWAKPLFYSHKDTKMVRSIAAARAIFVSLCEKF